MTAAAVLIILTAVAAPAIRRAVVAYRGAEATSSLTASLALARITAVTRNEDVVMCPSSDGQRCGPRGDWTSGWIVFPDPAGTLEPGEAGIVAYIQRAPGTVSLTSSDTRRFVRFQPSGWASGTNLTVHVCAGPLGLARVILNNAGRARVERRGAGCRSA